MLTIAQTIQVGDVSVYLAANYNAKQGLFGGALANPTSPVTIIMCTDALRWGLAGGAQSAADLRSVANYDVWLCGKFGLEATRIIGGSGGGSVVPGGLTGPSPYDFIVSFTSFIPTGGTSVSISAFIGFEVGFNRGGQPQYTTDPGDGSNFYTWNKTTGLFSISGAAIAGEQMRIFVT